MIAKIRPVEEFKEERKTVMYCGIEITDEDTDDESSNNIIVNKRPSDIKINDVTNYETDSDDSGYNENEYSSMYKRQPSFIRKSIGNFSQKVVDSGGTTKQTLGSSIVLDKKRPCCSIKSFLCFGFI
jgi:hypothetical protein